MFRNNLRSQEQSLVFKQSIEQLGRELGQFFPDREYTPSYQVKAANDISDISKLKTKEKFAIPFFTYRIDSMAPNRDRFNRTALRRHGIVIDNIIKPAEGIRPDDPNKVYHSLHLTPVDVTFDIIYVCPYTDMYDFGPMWQQAAQEHYLNFQLEVGEGKLIPINVELSEDITFSDIDFDNGNYTQFVTSAVMSTYHGVVSNIRQISSYKVKTGVIHDRKADTAELAPSIEIVKQKDTVVFAKHKADGG